MLKKSTNFIIACGVQAVFSAASAADIQPRNLEGDGRFTMVRQDGGLQAADIEACKAADLVKDLTANCMLLCESEWKAEQVLTQALPQERDKLFCEDVKGPLCEQAELCILLLTEEMMQRSDSEVSLSVMQQLSKIRGALKAYKTLRQEAKVARRKLSCANKSISK